MVQKGGGGTQDAKHVLDSIGGIIQKQAQDAADQYREKLKGHLLNATYRGIRTRVTNVCDLDYNYETSATTGNTYPCLNRSRVRFSDTEGAYCSRRGIKGNNTGSGGACAPYRRLHVCDKNLEQIQPHQINNTDNLLADVCLAAKHEGESLVDKHEEYKKTHKDSNICTILARSFADIGDIVRGRDLFLGHQQRKKKLEERLEAMFENIKNNNEDKLGHLSTEKVREYWWALNRVQVWKAITCAADDNDKYSKIADDGSTLWNEKCGHHVNQDVPTNLDYVPQYLRWFEEWAEDFCRKKKKYVDIVKKYCRGERDGEKYCSRNGYDCEKTKRAIGRLRMGNQCISCLYACNPYVDWIDNQRKQFLKQKEQFLKQKERYDNVISGASRSSRKTLAATTTNYDGYEKIFYEKLKAGGYPNVHDFLKKLSNEDVCKRVDDEEGGKINFAEKHDNNNNDETKGTFYRSKYCQPCPLCGMKKKDDGSGWEEKNNGMCKSGNLYRPKVGKDGTPIKILKSGEKQKEIETKLKAFCNQTNGDTTNAPSGGVGGGNSNSSLYDPWKCYKEDDIEKHGDDDDDDVNEVTGAGGLCILENKNKNERSETNSQKEPDEIQKTFNDFFYYWVAHMLKDSIHWRTKKLVKCLKNGNTIKCGKNCKDDCDCYKRWIGKKENEWKAIKDHFGKQDFGSPGGILGEGMRSPDFVLKTVLELEFANENTKEDKENNVSAEEAKEIQHLRKMLQETADGVGTGVGGTGSANGQKTLMDKLIDYEKDEAEKCKDCPKPQQNPSSGGRSLPPSSPAVPVEDESEEEEEEDEEHGPDGDELQDAVVEEPEAEEKTETAKDSATAETQQPPQPAATTTPTVDVCATVKKALEDNLSEACEQKYGHPQRHWGWKCISATTGDKGATCIPPRRRKLYLGGFKRLTDGTPVSSEPTPATASPSPSDRLLTAFVESAAVETFFLWHRYKKIKEKEEEEKQAAQGNVYKRSEDPEQNKLNGGTIPEEFKRQMFYTLGDYRDILFGDKTAIDTLKASDDNNIETIKKAIDEILSKQSRNNQQSGQKSVDPRKTWWDQNAQHIWEGMVCALSYDTDKTDDKKIKKNEQVETKLKEKLKKNGEQNGDYHYDTVTLEDDSDETGRPKETSAAASSDTPLLSHFISRPPFVRWLEEWGETFCKKRARMLKDVRDNCMEDGRRDGKLKQKYSEDGEQCDRRDTSNEGLFAELDKPSCATPCRLYKKWIERKRTEYDKQSNAYEQQKTKYQRETKGAGPNNGDNGFCGTVQRWPNAAAFLQRLAPCKTNNGNENEEDKLNFSQPDVTFRPATNCKPCSEFKINCQNGNCGADTNGKCNGTTNITAKDIETMGTRTDDVSMLVSDNDAKGFHDLNEACENAHIFKGIRKDVWKCDKVCGYDVCGLKKNNNDIDQKQIILIRALFKRWVENFLKDYNEIKRKISHCINNGNGSICTSDCGKKCNCVDTWITEKRKEWENIKNRYVSKNERENADSPNTLTNFLEPFTPQIAAANYKQEQKSLEELEKSLGCNCTANIENGTQKDIIDCLLDKLENLKNEIRTCQNQHVENSDHISGQNLSQCQNTPPDDEEEYENENEKKVGKEPPTFCEKVVQKEPDGTDDACKPVTDGPKKDEPKDGGETQEDKKNEIGDLPAGSTDEAPSEEPGSTPPHGVEPSQDAKEPAENKGDTKVEVKEDKTPAESQPKEKQRQATRVKPRPPITSQPEFWQLVSVSAFPWTVGVAFVALSYWLLKKKTKPRVDLFSVMEIPQNDYGMPTLKSKNRYVPYSSGKYRGKTYLYVEGDSGTDSGYTDHYSDITSSSESEYEELDINDIYAPRAPKYKTLIEVVLEPSKRDIKSNDISMNKFTDDEWNQLKHDFISNMLQNTQNTEPNILHDNVDNNTHPTMSRHNIDQKPFIMLIQDRNLLIGEEHSYNMSTNSGGNGSYSGISPISDNPDSLSDKNGPTSGNHNLYSGTDLINDALSGDYDIYDEMLKRKENELFGTNHTKHTNTYNVAKPARDDPITNQLNLFHKWLDRHRNMCEKWDKNNKVDILNKLKKKWDKDNNSGIPSDNNKRSDIPSVNNIPSDIPSGKLSDTPSDNNIHSDIPYVLNSDVSIQIHMDNPKPTNEFTYVDSDPILTLPSNPNPVENNTYVNTPTNVQIEMDVNNHKVVKEKYPISDMWDI
ncbi:hypothetical protein PFUGPA_00519 [Plasmodium falciparum Palo Alto/Uganda]|uniref:Erythrocyte membrane protein 1 n=1 Tax=Plasmodium falciparum (isolate Palo Alto / Uganda) TaxID=57270 RepID=W4J7K9_PLAFP|nr:hypothetical protein PFUGPA_00519 [Plasmodium falciparum Palo Alto/Uganda]